MPTTYELALFRNRPRWFKSTVRTIFLVKTPYLTIRFGPAIQKGIDLSPAGIRNSNEYFEDAEGIIIKYFNIWHPIDYITNRMERLFDWIEDDPDTNLWYEFWEGKPIFTWAWYGTGIVKNVPKNRLENVV